MRLLPVLPVAIPLLMAAALAALTKLISASVSTVLALAAVLATGWAALSLLRESLSQTIVYWFGGWTPAHGLALGISFTIDPFGAGLALFTSVLTLAALVFAAKYFDSVGNHFHALILVFLAAMCGFSLTGDMFNMFVFFELMSAAAFALCGYKTEDPGTLQGSINFAVTNTIGAYFALSGIALLYARTGALNLAQIGVALRQHPADKLVAVAFTFLCCGYLVKAAIVPFHFWLADAHAVAPTPVCVLFSGVMVELGLYAVCRIYWTAFDGAWRVHLPQLRALFLFLGTVTAVGGAIMCYSQRNVKRLLAFSTISHMGLITMGVGLFSAMGLAGSAVYTLGHGAVKGGLFLVAGILLHRFGSVDEMDLHGKGVKTKLAGVLFFLGGAGLSGSAPAGLWLGEGLIHRSAESIGYAWTSWIFLFAGTLTSAAVLRVGGRIFLGWGPSLEDEPGSSPKSEEKQETSSGHECTPVSMIAPAAVLVVLGFSYALVPGIREAAVKFALRFNDSASYAAHVLDGVPNSSPPVPPQSFGSPYWGVCALALAISVAALHLRSERFRDSAVLFAKPATALQMLHSGHVGDYVAFLTFGIAGFGLFCLAGLAR
jgi:multicomponent Na+:H+ antiporter subunit D